jgi:hypothetical protein
MQDWGLKDLAIVLVNSSLGEKFIKFPDIDF